jgi:hypothetical protein
VLKKANQADNRNRSGDQLTPRHLELRGARLIADWIEVAVPKRQIQLSETGAVKASAVAIDEALRRARPQIFDNEPGRIAYVTLASPDYEWGLRVLLRSLRRVSALPVIVMSTQRWSFDCSEDNITFIEVPGLTNAAYRPERHEFGVVLAKLWVFGLTGFRRVTFIDADSLVLRPIDDFFDLKGFWACPDFVNDSTRQGFNSGLLSFEPTAELRDRIFDGAREAKAFDHADQGLLNALLWQEVRLLPPETSPTRHYDHFAGPELKRDRIRIVHYIVKKPWEMRYRESIDAALLDMDDLWTQQLDRDELLDLIAFWRRRQALIDRSRFESKAKEDPKAKSRKRKRLIAVIAAVALGVILFGAGFLAGSAP